MKNNKRYIIMAMLFAVCAAMALGDAHAGAYRGKDGEIHSFGSDAWRRMGPRPMHVVLVPHHHYLASKRFCLMHVDRFMREVKASNEDHLRLANLCSRGLFHTVWKLTGGEEPKLTHHGYESVHEWEKEVREAVEHLPDHGIPSEAWRKHLMGLANKPVPLSKKK